MSGRPTAYAIKTAIDDLGSSRFAFARQKTMYGGKRIAAGDRIYLFASENGGGHGLFARGIVAESKPVARDPALARQTPRVSILVEQIDTARRRLGRAELRPARDCGGAAPETELDFKLYRQATDKVVGLTPAAARFLDTLF